MKTKAAVLYAIGEPLVIEELELEAPRENEILIRCVASGICHSDYSVRDGLGIIGADWGIEFCVHGLDRNLAYAYSSACREARP